MVTAKKKVKKKTGLAALSPTRRAEIARMGRRAVEAQGKLYMFTPKDRSKGGKRGGLAVSRNREWMSKIGKLGSQKSGRAAKKRKKGTPKKRAA